MDEHPPITCSTFAHMFGQYGRRRIMIQVFAPAAVLFGLGYWGNAAKPNDRPQPYVLDPAEIALLTNLEIGSILLNSLILSIKLMVGFLQNRKKAMHIFIGSMTMIPNASPLNMNKYPINFSESILSEFA